MLEIKYIRKNLSVVQKALQARGDTSDLDGLIKTDEQRRTVLSELEALRHERNTVTDQIAELKKSGQPAEEMVSQMRTVSSKIKSLQSEVNELETEINATLMQIPNVPHPSVPSGLEETDNTIVKIVGTPPDLGDAPQAHWTLGEALRILDFERAARITGARFPLYIGLGARLERALINFMLDVQTNRHGYLEVLPPFMVNRQTMTHTGQLPKFEEDLFKLEGWDYFLIPTAEVPVTNIHQNEILDEDQLPIYYTAYTPCFRSEAGSYGKDTRGLIRQHQFNKVELVKFVRPETSYDELETLLGNAEKILQLLELPYRVVTLCTGDLGFSSAKTYDIEVWMPSQGVYREISSCSNFEAFQARRANIRYRRKGHKGTDFIHTLNGSGLAVGRTFAAIIENFQQPDGSVLVPRALQPFLDDIEVIK